MKQVNNHKVNKVGREIAYNLLKRIRHIKIARGQYVDYFCDKEKSYPIFYWTKTYQTRKINGETYSVTGKSMDRMVEISKLAFKQGDVYLVWIDALLGKIIGGRYSELLKKQEDRGNMFPILIATHKGGVLYFNIEKVDVLAEIPANDLQTLQELIAENRTPKGQLSLL